MAASSSVDSHIVSHDVTMDFDEESVALIAKFLGKKNSLTSFSLVGAAVDNDNKTL